MRAGLKQSAVGHDPFDLLGIADIACGIMTSLDHDQVGQLADFQGTQVLVQSQVLGAVERAAPQCFQGRHAALHETPQLPVRANAAQLSVPARLNQTAVRDDLPGDLRDLDVIVIFQRRLFAAT